MNKNKKKLLAYQIGIIVIGLFGIGMFVMASIGGSFWDNLVRYVGDKVTNQIGTPQVEDIQVGASAGPDHYFRQNFLAGFTRAGDVYSTTSAIATYTLESHEIDGDVYYISWLPNLITTVTLPATTSAGFTGIVGTQIGSTREYILYNASTSATAIITLAAGTGIDLQKNEDTANLATTGTGVTKLTFIRKADSDVLVIMDQWDVAD